MNGFDQDADKIVIKELNQRIEMLIAQLGKASLHIEYLTNLLAQHGIIAGAPPSSNIASTPLKNGRTLLPPKLPHTVKKSTFKHQRGSF